MRAFSVRRADSVKGMADEGGYCGWELVCGQIYNITFPFSSLAEISWRMSRLIEITSPS